MFNMEIEPSSYPICTNNITDIKGQVSFETQSMH